MFWSAIIRFGVDCEATFWVWATSGPLWVRTLPACRICEEGTLETRGSQLEVFATPLEYGATGLKSYYCSNEDAIHIADKKGEMLPLTKSFLD